jgi:hypothetical protein
MDDLNHIPYFSEIEETFIRLRGKSLLLSPLDWTLIESWKERAIPLHVVTRSIEEVFKSRGPGAGRRRINSLRYCQDEVEEQFAQWKKMRVGSHDAETRGHGDAERNPFNRETVRAHMRSRFQLLFAAQNDKPEALRAELVKATGMMITLHDDFSRGGLSVQQLEDELTRIDGDLDRAIEQTATEQDVAAARAKVEETMAPYKNVMPAEVYQRQFAMLLAKHLREIFGVPRLSLFHMK